MGLQAKSGSGKRRHEAVSSGKRNETSELFVVTNESISHTVTQYSSFARRFGGSWGGRGKGVGVRGQGRRYEVGGWEQGRRGELG